MLFLRKMLNIKDKLLNEKKEYIHNSLTKNESLLLNKILEEYNDLFPEIMHQTKENFLNLFQKYTQIYFASKNILFSNDSLNKIMKIIFNEYYLPEKEKIESLIKSLDENPIYNDKDNKNFIPHCYKTNEPIHICGEKLYKLDKGNYYYCLKCNKIYEQKSVLLFCENCQKDYYSEIKENINKNKIDYKLKPATWAKYHCNVSMNDTMKCPKCLNNFYLNMKNRLFCIKCNYDIDQHDIKWKCQICSKDFFSEAKEYNPLVFKVIRLTVKRTIFNNIEAKPSFIPCCIVSKSEIKSLKFIHKKECNNILYEGILDNKKIVVCLKCNMLNFYDNHFWMCPICKNKYSLNNNNYENNLNLINKEDKLNYYKTDKTQKKFRKFINNYDYQKKINNYGKYKDELEIKSYRKNNNEKSNEEQNLIMKKYKSGNISNIFYNKTDEINNNNIFRNYKNKKNYENFYNIKNSSLNRISKKNKDFSQYNPNNEINNNLKEYKNNKDKQQLYDSNEEINEINNEKIFIKSYYENNNDKNEFVNNSSKFLRIVNHIKEKQKRDYSQNYNSNKNNNIKSLHNIINNLSNININLNVNVNINNSQKEKLLKSMSSYKDIQKNQNINRIKDSNANVKSFRKHLKNLSINLTKDIPLCTLKNFDIDDYNIVKQIGEGTFGKIFEVEDKYHRHFAMKKLICNSLKEIELLKKEYEFLYNFKNFDINLVQIYGIETKKLDRTTFVMYVLMELAKIDWEKEIIKRKKINNYYSEEELINILKDLTSTLSQLQKNNISHRDIKPQNILLCSGDILKISDFGEAKENDNNDYNDTIKQTIRGTELYMSPALFKSLKQKIKTKYTKHNTYKSDVFSLGYCILLAASLNFDCLYSIRELQDMALIKSKIKAYIKERYSDKFINIILDMLETDEKNRPDFVLLEKKLKKI